MEFLRRIAVCSVLAALWPAVALAAPTTYSSGNLATSIPDGASIESALNVPDVGEILSVSVAVNVGHGRDADVNLDLVHPDGTVVRLSHGNGGTGDNYGSGSDCSGSFTEFSATAVTPVTAASPPFIGSFKPEETLAVLAGKPSSGGWKLVLGDDAAGVIGTLWCWKLSIEYAFADLALGTTATPEPVTVGETLVYTHVVTNNGPQDSRVTTLTDTLPEGVALVSVQTTQGTCAGVATVTCTLGALALGKSATVTIAVEPTAPGTLTNSTTVAGTPDPSGKTANNTTATVTTAVGPPPGERRCTIVGTKGDDVLAGTSGNDVICGLSGNDRIFGGEGDDVLYGDGGNDRLSGEEGNDALAGGAGSDALFGGEGSDRLLGGAGDDRVVGDAGNDRLTGGAGRDRLNGGEGRDYLDAKDRRRDDVRGGPGKDRGELDRNDLRRSVEVLL